MGGSWGLATVIGAIIFLVVLAYVMTRNRRSSEANRRLAETSARELREEIQHDQDRAAR